MDDFDLNSSTLEVKSKQTQHLVKANFGNFQLGDDLLYLSRSLYFDKHTIVPETFFISLVEEEEWITRGYDVTLVPR